MSANTASGLSAITSEMQVLVLPTRDMTAILRTQVVLRRDPDGSTEKYHIWNAPESEADPHDHPWVWFDSTVIKGTVTEEVFEVIDGVLVSQGVRTHNAGDTYRMKYGTYHRTVSVEPGTITHFRTGPWVKDASDWGWHNGTERIPAPDTQDDAYQRALAAANPTFGDGTQWPALLAALTG